MIRGVVGYKIPEYLEGKYEDLLEMVLGVAQEQLICNLPSSKVLIFNGKDERDPKKAAYSFKIIGGEKPEDDRKRKKRTRKTNSSKTVIHSE